MDILILPLERRDMDAVALVHRASFDERLPWLAGLHTPQEDRAFFNGPVFDGFALWGAFEGTRMIGFIAFRDGSIEHLYVLPADQGRGAGTRLLTLAQRHSAELSAWTFQRNEAARRFYERSGFVPVEESDGSRNEEREPDVRYHWRA